MAMSHHPFSIPLYFSPEMLDEPPENAYLNTKRDIVGADEPDFGHRNLPGQLIHAAFILGDTGIQELWLPGKSLVVTDAWDTPQAADQTFATTIEPVFTGSGRPRPERLTSVDLIGCMGNPLISDFDADRVCTSILVWPDYGKDAGEIYAACFTEIVEGQPLPEGSGAHFAYRAGNQVITWEIWRSQHDLEVAMRDRIMPGVARVLDKLEASHREPTIVTARAVGLAVREEVRYSKAA